jgi:hypothetical protein
MTETTLPTAFPARQAAAIPGRSARNKVTGKLKVALELMVWHGTKRADAAEQAGLADSSLRFALRKPHVLQHFNAELATLRNSLRARNLHRLDGIADSSRNGMARVASIKALEQIADDADQRQRPGSQQLPGLQIVNVQAPGSTAPPRILGPAPFPAPPAAISHEPIEHEPARPE